jgi:hypothetical protein
MGVALLRIPKLGLGPGQQALGIATLVAGERPTHGVLGTRLTPAGSQKSAPPSTKPS